MWRSFFIALGVFMILLGLQALVVDQFLLSHHQRIPRFITSKDGIFASTNADLANQQPQNSRYDLASFGQTTTNKSSQFPGANDAVRVRVTPASSDGPKKIITTKDWMPWSLLAAGTLLVIYTRATVGLIGDS